MSALLAFVMVSASAASAGPPLQDDQDADQTPTPTAPSPAASPSAPSVVRQGPVQSGTVPSKECRTGQPSESGEILGSGTVNDAAISPDGGFVAVASSRSVDLYRITGEGLPNGTRLAQLGCEGTGNLFLSVAFGHRGEGTTVLAAGASDGRIRLWSITDGTGEVRSEAIVESGLNQWIRSLAIDDKGRLLAAGTENGAVLTWKLPADADPGGAGLEGPAIWRGPDPEVNAVRGLAFSIDGSRLAAGLSDRSVQLFNIVDGGHTTTDAFQKLENWVRGVAFVNDTTLVTASKDGSVSTWDLSTSRSDPVRTNLLPPNDVVEATSVTATRDGIIVAGFSSGDVGVWKDGVSLAVDKPKAHRDWLRRVAAASGAGIVVTASDDTTVQIWSVAPNGLQNRPKYATYTSSVSALAFGAVDLFTGGGDGQIRRWRVGDGSVADTLHRPEGDGPEKGVLALAFPARAPGLFASGGKDGKVWIWRTGPPSEPIFSPDGHGDWVRQIAFSPDGTAMATVSDGSKEAPHVFDVTPDGVATLATVPSSHPPSVSSVSLSNARVATASNDGKVRVWSRAQPEATLRELPGESSAASVAFSSDGKLLAAGYRDGSIRIWVVPDDGDIAGSPTTLGGHYDVVLALAWSPATTQGNYLLASGGADTTVRLWSVSASTDSAQAQPLKVGAFEGTFAGASGHHDWVRSVAFSADGKLIASGADDGLAIVHSVPGS
ncbi:MAG: WD40 repeat domain-containing protein [Chloroflexota bacterium]